MATTTPRRRERVVPHLSIAERTARGKAARSEVPRSSHAEFQPSSARVDPIDLLERQAATRVPELVPIRYGRMLNSPFAFYRGAALIMAEDLSATPRSGLMVQCCGDAHMSNFGVFASPERRLVFDVNDFDETLPGPWEWDVKRLAASTLIAGRDNGFAAKDQDAVVLSTVGSYRSAMREFSSMNNLEVWYAHADTEMLVARYGSQLKPKQLATTEKQLAKARTRDSMTALSKLCAPVDGELRIVDESPLIVPITKLTSDYTPDELFEELRRYIGPGALPRGERVPQPRPARRGRPAADAGGERHLPRLAARRGGPRRQGARLLRAPVEGLEGLGGDRADGAGRHGRLREDVRVDAGARARAQRRPHRDRLLPRKRRRVRPRDPRLLEGLRRPERTRLQVAPRCDR
jgi:hypothetical protein